VEGSGRPLSGAAEYGGFKGLGDLVTAGTGGRGVVAPGGVCAEVALARPHLVKAARGELVEAHEWVGLDRGAVRVSGRVRCGLFPLLDEEVPTLELQLGVGAARGRGEGSVRKEGAGRSPGGVRIRQGLG